MKATGLLSDGFFHGVELCAQRHRQGVLLVQSAAEEKRGQRLYGVQLVFDQVFETDKAQLLGVESKLSGIEVPRDVIVVVPEIQVSLHKVVHKLHHGQVLGDAERGVVLVEVKLRNRCAFGVAVGHDDFGLGVQVPHGQFIDVAVGIENAWLSCGLFEKRFEFCNALLRHHDLGPWHGGLADVAVGGRVCVFEQTGLAQDLHHILLGEVSAYFLVRTDDDVIGLGVPCVAQEVNGLGIDEGWNHAIAVAGMQESMLRAFGLRRDDVLDGLAHGDWRFAVHHKDEGKSDLQH